MNETTASLPDADELPGVEAPPDATPGTTPQSSDPASEGASTPEGEAKEGEPKLEETPEAKAEKEKADALAHRLRTVEVAKRAQLNVAKKEQAVVAREQQLVMREQQMAQQLQANQQVVAQAREALGMLEQLKREPTLERLQALGLDYKDLTRQMVEAQAPDARVRQLEKQVEEERTRRTAESEKQTAAAQIQEQRQMATTLVSFVEEAAAEFPTIFEYPPEQIAADGLAFRDAYVARYNQPPTYEQTARALEQRAQQLEAQRAERRARRPGTNPAAPANASTNAGQQASPRPPPARPTLTNTDAATRATPPREKTESEIDAEMLAQIRALR